MKKKKQWESYTVELSLKVVIELSPDDPGHRQELVARIKKELYGRVKTSVASAYDDIVDDDVRIPKRLVPKLVLDRPWKPINFRGRTTFDGKDFDRWTMFLNKTQLWRAEARAKAFFLTCREEIPQLPVPITTTWRDSIILRWSRDHRFDIEIDVPNGPESASIRMEAPGAPSDHSDPINLLLPPARVLLALRAMMEAPEPA